MPTFTYHARNFKGDNVDGEIVAMSRAGVAEILQQQGLIPIEIMLYEEKFDLKALMNVQITQRRIKAEELSLFCRQMHTMLKAGVPIINALNRLADTARDAQMKKVLLNVIAEISAGHNVNMALRQHPKIFKSIVVNMVEAGEQSGQLDQTFLQLASYYELEDRTAKRLIAATRYPIMVVVAVIAGIMVLNFFVIPAFAKLYANFHSQLPLPSRIIIAISHFLTTYWLPLLGLIVLMIFAFKFYINTEDGRMSWDHLRLNFPVFGKILRKIILARLSRVFTMMLRSGVPLVQCVELLSKTVNNKYVGKLVSTMQEGVERGDTVLQSATRTGLFSKMILQMIAIGEESGTLDDMLDKVADYYEADADYDLSRLSELIQPLLIVIMGAMVLVLALGVFLPMWDMVNFAKGA